MTKHVHLCNFCVLKWLALLWTNYLRKKEKKRMKEKKKLFTFFRYRRQRPERSLDDILVDDYARQRDGSVSPDRDELAQAKRKRLRSLTPPRRRRSLPFVPPARKTYFKPMSDDDEVWMIRR